MMKNMLCLLLALLLCPMGALAEESTAEPLSLQELTVWAESYRTRALNAEPRNVPADSLTADGYEFIYDFATLYADTPDMSSDTALNAVVLTSDEEKGPRSVSTGDPLAIVLGAYYTENPDLMGTKESALLYAMDQTPSFAAWGQVLRDGQRVQTVQYAVHEQLATGGEGYTDAGVIYTMVENRVSAVRVYGLNSRVTLEQVKDVADALSASATKREYAQVPFSYQGAELEIFAPEDLAFSGMDFLTLTPDAAVTLLGETVSDEWMDNGEDGYIRVQTFHGCELTWLVNPDKTESQVYMLLIDEDGLEGPRAVRCGDSFTSVYNRFRNGEGEYLEDGTEMLYGETGSASFGKAAYGSDASAVLRYAFTLEDGRQVVLQLDFAVMTLDQIMLFVD